MLHEINHGVVFPGHTALWPQKAVLGRRHSSLLWFCGLLLLDFSGEWTLTAGASQGEKGPPGGRGTGSGLGVPTWTELILLIAWTGRAQRKQLRVPLGPQLPSGWASGARQDAGWFQEAPGHLPCSWVFLRRPMAPPALPLTATGWQQRSPWQWLSPWPVWWPVGKPAGSGARGWVGVGRPWGPSVAAMVSPIKAHPLQCLQGFWGSSSFLKRVGSRRASVPLPGECWAPWRCRQDGMPNPKEAQLSRGLSGEQEPRVGLEQAEPWVWPGSLWVWPGGLWVCPLSLLNQPWSLVGLASQMGLRLQSEGLPKAMGLTRSPSTRGSLHAEWAPEGPRKLRLPPNCCLHLGEAVLPSGVSRSSCSLGGLPWWLRG